MALHHLAKYSGFNPSNVEKITPQKFCLGTTHGFNTSIASSKENAIEWDKDNFSNRIMIYTDRSGYQGMTGAAAILYITSTAELRYQLGTLKQHTVFEGELVAIILGIHLAKDHLVNCAELNLSIDNQATIKSLKNNCAQPIQHLIDKIKTSIDQLLKEETRR
jgi:hypothetical protein